MPRRTDRTGLPPRMESGGARTRLAPFASSAALATLAIVGLPALAATAAPPTVEGLQTEHLEDPLGIDAKKPRLSWRLRSEPRGVLQSPSQLPLPPTH